MSFSSLHWFCAVFSTLFMFSSLSAGAADKQTGSQDRERKGIHLGAYPSAKYTTDEGLSVGAFARVFDYADGVMPYRNLWTFWFSTSEAGANFGGLEYSRTGLGAWDLRSDSLLYGLDSPEERYYGLGQDAPFDKAREADGYNFYHLQQWTFRQTFRKKLESDWEPLAGVQVMNFSLRPNRLNTRFAEDFGQGTENIFALAFRAGVVREKRDNEFIPQSGHYFASILLTSPSLLSNTGTFTRWDNDFRYYHPIFENRWLWLATQLRTTTSTDSAPLPYRATLGSESNVRGIRTNRLTANHSASLRAELRSIVIRWKVFGLPLKAGGGPFVDTGTIGSTLGQLFQGELQKTAGFSFFGSYFTDDFLGHADIGFSKESTQVYLGLGHAF